MDTRTETREFLASRRARITPQQVGLPAPDRARRVKGLRREEVALLAGISPDYYNRLERGNLAGASESVLTAIADALHLDEAERSHLYALAHATHNTRAPAAAAPKVRPNIQRVLDTIMSPAQIRNGRGDILAANTLGYALFAPMFDHPTGTANTARFAFLDPRAHEFYPDWERTANSIVARLRAEAGRRPNDRALTDLIGELCTRSTTFATRWAKHDVIFHRSGTKTVHHPVVGPLDLAFETMQLGADPGLSLVVYTAQPDSPATADALALLASWSTTLDDNQPSQTATTPNPLTRPFGHDRNTATPCPPG